MNDCVWVVSFYDTGLIANIYVTSTEHASESAKYYRKYYPSVRIYNEEQLNKALNADVLIKEDWSLT